MPSDRLTDDVGPTLEDELDRLEEENEQLRKEVEWLRGEDRQMRQALDDIVEMCNGRHC
jgi:predicted  nucleic acid-binding Zn-ribbon protein